MERIGGYLVERCLGEGGMGTVHLARSRGGRPVAVKVARPELAADPSFRERFRAEVAAARKVGGFHTAPVVDADPDADPPWLATAYIPGPTLADLIGTQGAMDEPSLRTLGAALAEALIAVHACGLVHRDLKPGNIIMAEDGPRVLDFGIARAVESTRLTATGTAFGTPGYLAPEQALGEEVTGAADVFALGAVLVAAAGGRAFGGGTPMGLMYRSVHEPADVSAVPPGLRETVTACLAKSPEERPGPAALLDALAPLPAATAVAEPEDRMPTAYAAAVRNPAPPSPATPPVARLLTPPPVDAEPAPADAVPLSAGAVPSPADAEPPSPVPVFHVADRFGSVTADEAGIVLAADDAEAEFGWDEVGQVEYTANPRGTRFELTVTLYDGKAYRSRLYLSRSAGLHELTAQLDRILSHCFPAPADRDGR
ncbi:serine/threonine-protein kinase [Streptomyces sp. NPDC006294]|uniref:serine/threonine-protein kinase n=1 Tax=Streptomyces sp. NPDC006294 TaxID=3364743 RepID=UPI0036AE5D3B